MTIQGDLASKIEMDYLLDNLMLMENHQSYFIREKLYKSNIELIDAHKRLLELNGQLWNNLVGKDARDSNKNILGKITDQFIEDNKMVFVINDDYEIATFEVNEIIYPENYIVLA